VIAPLYAYWYEDAKPSAGWFIGGTLLVLSIVMHSCFALSEANQKAAAKEQEVSKEGAGALIAP